MVEVVAAYICRGDKFLICQRPANKARGLLWEFAGGKVEPGEDPREALVRECGEELGITVKPLKLFAETTHKYPDLKIKLTVYRAEITEGEPKLLEHAAIRWITAAEIPDFNFCAADGAVLKKISRENADTLHKKRLGRKGERSAAKLLKKEGYKIVAKNYRTPFCEVDIIAKRGDVLVFCEVKTRLNKNYGEPQEAVDEKKQRLYARAARAYMAGKDDIGIRFDVIAVDGKKITHFENAFYAN